MNTFSKVVHALCLARIFGRTVSERNRGYTRLKGPFDFAEGQGVNCPLSVPLGSGPAWEEELFPHEEQCGCIVCVWVYAHMSATADAVVAAAARAAQTSQRGQRGRGQSGSGPSTSLSMHHSASEAV